MNIGINAQLLSGTRTGIGNHILQTIKALSAVDTRNTYYIFVNGKGVELPPAANLKIIKTALKSTKSWARILWEQLAFPREPAVQDLDLMHFPDYALPVMFNKLPMVCTVYDLSFRLFPQTFSTGKRYTKLALIEPSVKKADKIIVISENTKQDLMELYKVPEEKIRVTYCGVDPEVYRPLPQEAVQAYLDRQTWLKGRQSPDRLQPGYILYVGTLEPRKNVTSLIKAYHLLKKDGQTNAPLIIAGSKGWLYEDIFRTVSELKLENDVIFTGYVSDEELPVLYNGAGVFVYPSLYEGFGLPPLEAMACGTPVVSSNVSSIPEVVGDAGLLTNPHQVEDLAQAIQQVLTDSETATHLRAKGLERAKIFSWENVARRTLQVYEEVYKG